MFELIYTSAPKGILPGRTGFATVAYTAGMPPNLLTPLENLSGYEFTFQGSALPAEYNPPVYSFVRLSYGSMTLHVASRIAPNGLDYTMRNNKIAHHIMFENERELDQFPSGASSIFEVPGNFAETFEGAPRELAVRHIEDCAAPAELPAETWTRFTGDAGWAGVIAEYFLMRPEKPFFVEYPLSVAPTELLALLGEIAELLPPEKRKDFTFSTYFTRERPGEDCFLRMIPAFSPLLGALKRFHPEQILTLGEARTIPEDFAASERVNIARAGVAVPDPPSAAPEVPEPPIRLRDEVNSGFGRMHTAPPVSGTFRANQLRARITREEVEDPKPRTWKPWLIGVAVLVILLLVATMIYFFMDLARDVDAAIAQNIIERQALSGTEKTPTTAPTPTPAPKPTPAPAPEQKSALPVEAPAAAVPEAVTEAPLSDAARTALFISLEALKTSGNTKEIVELPAELNAATGIAMEPEDRKVLIQKGGVLVFSALPLLREERGKLLAGITKITFICPGKERWVYTPPKTGFFAVEAEKICYRSGDALPGVKVSLGNLELSDGKVLCSLPVTEYNKSVQKYAKALQKYFEKAGDGEPYTKESVSGALAKIEKQLVEPARKSGAKIEEKVIEELKALIDGAPFGRWKKWDFTATEIKTAVSDWVYVQFTQDETDKEKKLQVDREKVLSSLEASFADAEEREQADKPVGEYNFVRRQIGNIKENLKTIPVKDSKQMLEVFFKLLGIDESDGKGKRVLREYEVPNELTPERLADFCKVLDGYIRYEKQQDGAAL